VKVALIGLAQSGKTTIFSAISGRAMLAGGTAIEEAIVSVPDSRLDWLTEHYKPRKTTHASIDCLDVPGFNFTDEHGRAGARRLIGQLRTMDLLVLVLRAFQNPDVAPYRGRVDPTKDLAELQTELLLSDLELVATRIDKLEKQLHKPTATVAHDKAELALHKKLQQAIESERPISSAIETDAERETIKSLGFLTLKPIVVAVNADEKQLNAAFDFAGRLDSAVPVMTICARLERELAQLDAQTRAEFMADLGLKESAVGKFVNGCYSSLGLISFFTVISDEVRAWPIKAGAIALDAAGKVHTDIKRGFIRAETFAFEDLRQFGSDKALKAVGKVHLQGKDYVVCDGDVIHFRFNV